MDIFSKKVAWFVIHDFAQFISGQLLILRFCKEWMGVAEKKEKHGNLCHVETSSSYVSFVLELLFLQKLAPDSSWEK